MEMSGVDPIPQALVCNRFGNSDDAKSKGVHITQALSLTHRRHTLHGFSKLILILENSQWEGLWNAVVLDQCPARITIME